MRRGRTRGDLPDLLRKGGRGCCTGSRRRHCMTSAAAAGLGTGAVLWVGMYAALWPSIRNQPAMSRLPEQDARGAARAVRRDGSGHVDAHRVRAGRAALVHGADPAADLRRHHRRSGDCGGGGPPHRGSAVRKPGEPPQGGAGEARRNDPRGVRAVRCHGARAVRRRHPRRHGPARGQHDRHDAPPGAAGDRLRLPGARGRRGNRGSSVWRVRYPRPSQSSPTS